MVYLLLKIIVCLLLASILGAIIGWFLKRVFAKKYNNEQQRLFDVEREEQKKDLTQIENNWHSKYQSLNKKRNNIQILLDTSTQKNTLLSQSMITTQQTLNEQGEMLKHLQGDMKKQGEAKNELQNKNNFLAQEVIKLRHENKQIETLEDTIIQLNNIHSSLETRLKKTEAANETVKKSQLKKYHDLEKSEEVLKNTLKTAIEERDHTEHTLVQLKIVTEQKKAKEQQKSDELIIEKQQLQSIQQDEKKQQKKNNEVLITLRDSLNKTAKDNTTLKNKITALQQTKTDITTLKSKVNTLEKDKQQFEKNTALLKTDNAILKKDNQENDKKNTLLNKSLNDMMSKMERYKRYLIGSEKTWATKVYGLQQQVEKNQKNIPSKHKQETMNACKQKLIAIENDNKQLNKALKTLTEKNRHAEASLVTIQQDYIDLSQTHKALGLELEQHHKQKPKAAIINKARADDLQKIKGIGKYNERILNKLGITHYSQIADFTSQDEEKFSQALGVFATRISQEAWVGQAKILHQSKYGEEV